MIGRWVAVVVFAVAIVSALPGCKRQAPDRSAPPPAAGGPSLLGASALTKAMSALLVQIGGHAQVLQLLVYPDHVVVQAQDPVHPERVLQYEYRAGMVGKPQQVLLKGKGTLEDNLFPLEDAKLDVIPALAERAVSKVDAKNGKVEYVILKRDLPVDMDVKYRVFVKSPIRDGYVDADKNGKLVEQ